MAIIRPVSVIYCNLIPRGHRRGVTTVTGHTCAHAGPGTGTCKTVIRRNTPFLSRHRPRMLQSGRLDNKRDQFALDEGITAETK